MSKPKPIKLYDGYEMDVIGNVVESEPYIYISKPGRPSTTFTLNIKDVKRLRDRLDKALKGKR